MKRHLSRSTAVPSENEFDTMLAETSPGLFVDGKTSYDAVLNRVLSTRRLLQSLPPTKTDQAYLVQLENAPAYRSVEMRAVGEELTVGRTAGSQWCVSGAPPKLSSRHFMIRQQAGRYFLKDLGSMNGTRVNESAASVADHPLCSGDFIHAGGCTFLFVIGESADAA